jgi:hypothetical protein
VECRLESQGLGWVGRVSGSLRFPGDPQDEQQPIVIVVCCQASPQSGAARRGGKVRETKIWPEIAGLGCEVAEVGSAGVIKPVGGRG